MPRSADPSGVNSQKEDPRRMFTNLADDDIGDLGFIGVCALGVDGEFEASPMLTQLSITAWKQNL